MEPDEPARRDDSVPPPCGDAGEPDRGFTPPSGESHLEEITAHVERCYGPVRHVMHEVISDVVHIDVLIVGVSLRHPYITIVTSGMSALPMQSKDGGPSRCEVMMRLMANHPLSQEAFADEANYWPIRKLKMIARMPHLLGSSFAAGHTIATDPPEPVHPGSEFCALGLLEPLDAALDRGPGQAQPAGDLGGRGPGVLAQQGQQGLVGGGQLHSAQPVSSNRRNIPKNCADRNCHSTLESR